MVFFLGFGVTQADCFTKLRGARGRSSSQARARLPIPIILSGLRHWLPNTLISGPSRFHPTKPHLGRRQSGRSAQSAHLPPVHAMAGLKLLQLLRHLTSPTLKLEIGATKARNAADSPERRGGGGHLKIDFVNPIRGGGPPPPLHSPLSL